jgi:Fe-S-cluster containining protein
MTPVPECTGRCCDPVRISPGQYSAIVVTPEDFPDGPQIVAMLTPLGDATGAFRCSNFEPGSRRCRIYELRPQVCALYPNGGPCPHCGGGGPGTADAPPRAREPQATVSRREARTAPAMTSAIPRTEVQRMRSSRNTAPRIIATTGIW